MKRFVMRRLVALLCATGSLGFTAEAMASGFQLWEQDGATPGNYHAGYAASADNASIAYYNPAGITLFKNQEITVGGVAVLTDFKYKGDVTVATNGLGSATQYSTAQGGTFGVVPNLHYVTPLTDKLGFGFSIDAPFGLKTSYGNDTFVSYAATETSLTVIDVSPSLGLQVTDKASIGLGFDIQRMYAEFDSLAGLVFPGAPAPIEPTDSTNKADDTGYGYHAGVMYQFTPLTRAGLSYHSQVVHHLNGTSRFEGPLADAVGGGTYTSHASAGVTLPPFTALSVISRVHPRVALMGSIIYTQWDTFKNLVINDVSGIEDFDQSQSITVSIPEHYHNTWNATVGANYYATDKLMLRTGVGYDETPVTDEYRNVQLPDNDRYVIAFGGHYQATKAIGMDLSWSHFFFNQAVVNPPPQETGDQTVTTNGHATGGADVFGAQLTWDIV